MRTDAKKVFVTASAGVIGMLVLGFLCVKQCNDKNDAILERDVAKDQATLIADRKEENIALQDSLKTSRGVVDSLNKVVAARDDEVLKLRDALDLSKKSLDDCEKNKKVAKNTTTKKKTAGKKSVKKAPAKKICNTPGASAVIATATKDCDKKEDVVVCTEQVKATSPANANAVNATVGNNYNNINININNGTINNYYAPVDTVKKYDGQRRVIRVYGTRKVLCR